MLLVIDIFFAASVCTNDQFQCADGKCIDQDWKCDGDHDCDDHSDETKCKAEPHKNTCIETEWACLYEEQCILNNWKCDGDEDCFDGSDEKNCKLAVQINILKSYTKFKINFGLPNFVGCS